MKSPCTAFAFLLLLVCCIANGQGGKDKKGKPEHYSLTIYHFLNGEQERAIDDYLSKALLPLLHKNNFENVGVFKPIANDTAVDKRIYLLIKAKKIHEIAAVNDLLYNDPAYGDTAKKFTAAPYNNPPYTRYETILLQAFPLAKKMNMPALQSEKSKHVYELRSYESATDGLYKNKVKMFNEGGEIALFNRLGFNAVFYGEVLFGSRMPNLMYMTSFENMGERDAHWKTFSSDPEWKRLSSLPEYQHNVSKSNIILMHATAYSDF
jgi:hypothetical protein